MPCMHRDQVEEGEKHRQLLLPFTDHEFLRVLRHKGLFLCPKGRHEIEGVFGGLDD